MLVSLTVFVLMIVGELLLTGVNVRQLAIDFVQQPRRPPTAYEITTGESGNRVLRRLLRMFHQMRGSLASAGMEDKYPAYCAMSLAMAGCGAGLALFLENPFLLVPIALLGLCMPLLIAKRSASEHKKRQSAELLTGLSIITSSYMRTHDLISSVNENVSYLHDPVQSVFQRFIGATSFVTSNAENALYSIKGLIQNDIWAEWCDVMILCLHDHTKQNMLEGVLAKMRKMDTVQLELDNLLYEPIRQFITMIVLLLVNFPIMYFLNGEWFHILLFTIPGKVACAITAAALLYALFAVMRATSPIEYKR